jgi:hypothetical protein
MVLKSMASSMIKSKLSSGCSAPKPIAAETMIVAPKRASEPRWIISRDNTI